MQKTASEMRIIDWISDVCSSDLHRMLARRELPMPGHHLEEMPVDVDGVVHHCVVDELDANALARPNRDRLGRVAHLHGIERPQEGHNVSGTMDCTERRTVGKEGVSRFRYGLLQYH